MNDYKMNFYVDYINRNVLNRINYARLQEDYQTEEKAYAKSVLDALHQGVLEVYGTETFDRDTLEEGFVLLPGVLQSREKSNVCIALLELDLSSSGESDFFSTGTSGWAALKSSSRKVMCRTMPRPFVRMANLSA